MKMELFYLIFSDFILIVHFLYVAFVVVGELIIIVGGIFKLKFVRNPLFRKLHLLAIMIVSIEAILGMDCPLTVWEYELRNLAGRQVEKMGFIARIIHSILFYDFPQWVFNIIYISFGSIVLITYFLIPPEKVKSQNNLST